MRNVSRFRKTNSTHMLSMLAAICMSVGGFIMSIPFVWYMMFGPSSRELSLGQIASIVLIVIGLPMWLMGMIGIIARRNAGTSTLASDVSRIRFATETQMMNDLFKGPKQ